MPEGLQDDLSPQDFADLIAYLESLKASPEAVRRPAVGPEPRRTAHPPQETPR